MIHYVDTSAVADALALRIGQITAVALVAPGTPRVLPEPLKVWDAPFDSAQSTTRTLSASIAYNTK